MQIKNEHIAVKIICDFLPNFKPKIALILGSGLGNLEKIINNVNVIPFSKIPGFPLSNIVGHDGKLILGYINKIPIICMKGRGHFYENCNIKIMQTAVRTFKLLGCSFLLITSAAGSIKKNISPGDIVIIKDHINFMPGSTMAGENDEEFGPRFFSMNNAYDKDLRKKIKYVSKKNKILLYEGVYAAYPGPNFETSAEINMMKILGCDIVGMSVIPEVLVARHCGLKLLAISIITNYAEGLSDIILSHEQTLNYAMLIEKKFIDIINKFFIYLYKNKFY